MFIKLNENNEIIASASFKVDNTFIETDRNIVRNWDGKLVFKGEETEQPLEELRYSKKQELKQKRDKYKNDSGFSSFVYENLEFGLIEDVNGEREKWRIFLQDLIKKYDEFKEKIENSEDIEELKLLNIEF